MDQGINSERFFIYWHIELNPSQQNIGVDEPLKTIKVYRDVIWDYVEDLSDEKITMKNFLKINKIIDSILDHMAYGFPQKGSGQTFNGPAPLPFGVRHP